MPENNPPQFGANWDQIEALITARTYPTPASNGVEVSCTAGVTRDGKWVRLFPIPYRFLDLDKRFSKWQWIRTKVQRSSDPRPESYKIDAESIEILGPVPPKRTWDARKEITEPLRSKSLCELYRNLDEGGKTASTLGFFKPKKITKFEIVPDEAEWTEDELAKLRQPTLFEHTPIEELEKLPVKFYYSFVCDDDRCSGHRLSCTDWEMGQSFRSWRAKYGKAEWEEKFRQKFEQEMINRFDTSFFVGTLRVHPKNWIIVGLWYPLPG